VTVPVPIYQVVLRLGCGGLERMVVHLARALDPARYRVTVCCLEDPGELAEDLQDSAVKVLALGKKGSDPGAVLRLAQRLRQERVALVHTHNPAAHLYGTVAAWLAGVPAVVHTRHGPRDDDRNPAFTRCRWLWTRTSAAVAVSDDTAQAFLQRNRIAPEKVISIVNGVPIPVLRPEDRAEVRAEFGIPLDAPTLGIVARLAPEKDHRTLLTAFSRLRGAFPTAHLLIVGDGPLRSALEQQAQQQGIADRVIFAGFRSDATRLLAALDVFVLCSTYEGTSLTLLEAMASRLPVVATAVGGNPDVLGGPENGNLVPAQDPEALARALSAVLSDPAAAKAMAERAHARMKAHYGAEAMTARYAALYDRLTSLRSNVKCQMSNVKIDNCPFDI
jgi:sugar transferase (PEP-CTERM/EpsH1 system associated)